MSIHKGTIKVKDGKIYVTRELLEDAVKANILMSTRPNEDWDNKDNMREAVNRTCAMLIVGKLLNEIRVNGTYEAYKKLDHIGAYITLWFHPKMEKKALEQKEKDKEMNIELERIIKLEE